MSDPITAEIAHVARRRNYSCLQGAPCADPAGCDHLFCQADDEIERIANVTRLAMLDLARAAMRRKDIEVAYYWLERVERGAQHPGSEGLGPQNGSQKRDVLHERMRDSHFRESSEIS